MEHDIILRKPEDVITRKLSQLSVLVTDLSKLKTEMKYIKENKLTSDEISKISKKLAALVYRIASLETEFANFRTGDSMDQEWPKDNKLEINGVPMKEDENLFDIIKTLSQHINYSIKKTEINNLTRIPVFNSNEKCILVTFVNLFVKDEFVAAVVAKNGIKASDIGFHGNEEAVFVNDHWIPEKRMLNKTIWTLAKNFEPAFQNTDTKKSAEETATRKIRIEKPPLRPKPVYIKDSTVVADEGRVHIDNVGTLGRKYGNMKGEPSGVGITSGKTMTQLDIDQENLNRLMKRLYVTVTEACKAMDDDNHGIITDAEHTEQSVSEQFDGGGNDDSEIIKKHGSRFSSKVAFWENKIMKNTNRTEVYSSYRSWKSYKTDSIEMDSKFNVTDSETNKLSDNLGIDEKTGCVDIELPFDRERGLFNICLVVGLNYLTGEAYVKSVFPRQVKLPLHIENLIFPETLSSASKGEWSTDARGAQCYSLVLTDEKGERCFGYCRRVLPEGATTCLPICYCLIAKYRAPGFYYKVLHEIESHHGSSDDKLHSILQKLFDTDFPHPGEDIILTYYSRTTQLGIKALTRKATLNSGDLRPEIEQKNKKDFLVKIKTERYNVMHEGNNLEKNFLPNFHLTWTRTLRRPIESRTDENNLSVLLNCLGASLTIKVFASLLLERKVFIMGDKLSLVTSCLEALQSVLYPFVWQHPLISTIPSEIQREILETPLPMLAGMLKAGGSMDTKGIDFDEGMVIDLNHPSRVLFDQGDESTILPKLSYKTLKTTLEMDSKQKEDVESRNVMISEAFIRFFVDILGDFWRYFYAGKLEEGDLGKGNIVFDKVSFIKYATTKQNQNFLEWFTETAMFSHFIQNMAVTSQIGHDAPPSPSVTTTSPSVTPTWPNVTPIWPNTTLMSQTELKLVDTPLPDFYEVFLEKLSYQKYAVNKMFGYLKTKLRDLIA